MQAYRWLPLVALCAAGALTLPALGAPRETQRLRKELTELLRTPRRYDEKIAAIEALAAEDSPESVRTLVDAISKLVSRWDAENKERDRAAAILHELEKPLMSGPVRFVFEADKERYEGATGRAKELGTKRDSEQRMIRAAIEVLSGYRDAGSIRSLAGRIRERDPRLRAAVVEALSRCEPKLFETKLRQLLKDSSSRVRVIATLAVGSIGGSSHSSSLLELCEKDRSWAVRAAALRSLAVLKPKESIPLLIDRLTAEPGRLRADVVQTLQEITGQEIGANPGAWTQWWKQQGHDFEPRAGGRVRRGKTRAPIRYYGIDTPSRRIVFVIDTSQSMREVRTANSGTGTSTEQTKLEAARAELKRVLRNLDAGDHFGLVVYNNIVVKWRPGMVSATSNNIKAAEEYVESLFPTGETNVYDALEAAFNIDGFSCEESNYKEGVDTIFLLTDGTPSNGRLVEPREIRRQVGIWNQSRQVVIHCVGLGRDHGAAFLRNLVKENGGLYVTPDA